MQCPRLPCDSLCMTQSLTGLSASLTAHSRHQSFMTADVYDAITGYITFTLSMCLSTEMRYRFPRNHGFS